MNEKLINLLEIFKKGREKLSQDFLNENIEIFEAMFKYENENELMQLSIEKYIIEYINYHFKIFSKYKKNNMDVEFNKAMLSFMQKFNITTLNVNSDNTQKLFYEIIQQKLIILNKMIKM